MSKCHVSLPRHDNKKVFCYREIRSFDHTLRSVTRSRTKGWVVVSVLRMIH